jgi:hypothetical protein
MNQITTPKGILFRFLPKSSRSRGCIGDTNELRHTPFIKLAPKPVTLESIGGNRTCSP